MSCALLQEIMIGKDPVQVLGISQYVLDAALLLGDESECTWLYFQAVAYENGNGGTGGGGTGDGGTGDGGTGDGGTGDGGPTGPPDYQPPETGISNELIAAGVLLYFMFT